MLYRKSDIPKPQVTSSSLAYRSLIIRKLYYFSAVLAQTSHYVFRCFKVLLGNGNVQNLCEI